MRNKKPSKGVDPLRDVPITLPPPPKPLPELAADLAELLKNRPSNLDNPAITAHVAEKVRLRFWLDLYQWRAA